MRTRQLSHGRAAQHGCSAESTAGLLTTSNCHLLWTCAAPNMQHLKLMLRLLCLRSGRARRWSCASTR